MSKFQIITLGLFIVAIIAGVTAFALYKGSDSATKLPPITIWGTFPADTFNLYVAQINNSLTDPLSITYIQKSELAFSQDFVSALARGTGPDAILIAPDMILSHEDKVALIPYSSLPQRTFLDSYIDEASVYISANGILGIPFTVDPLVMYWNRDMFNSAGIAAYPHYWDEFGAISSKLTIKDQNGNITKTALPLGDFTNVVHSREILGSLFMQVGNPVTQADNTGAVGTTLRINYQRSPVPALQFFSQFIDPTDAHYSWNRGMPDSRTAFLSGISGTYIGFASELASIRAKNPNLNFDVAPLPQPRSGGFKAEYAKMLGFSLVRSSPNTLAAFQIISTLTDPTYMSTLSAKLYMPSVRRDVISQGTTDPYISIFNQAALISKTWIDVDPHTSEQIFGDMIEAITSGQKKINQALQDESDRYNIALKNAFQ